MVRTSDVDSKTTITQNLTICHSDAYYEKNIYPVSEIKSLLLLFSSGRCRGWVPAPPLLSLASNSQPVETGSDWEIPSRFSFQPMAPRKVWIGVTPKERFNWSGSWWVLPSGCLIGSRRCQSISIRSSAHATPPPVEKKRADSHAEWICALLRLLHYVEQESHNKPF